MKIIELLKVLIDSSEKAANIARKCRSNPQLFSLLIEEKTGSEKNERFFQDFKTLADVLIQETIRYEVAKLFPQLKDNVKGEESNKFENGLGDKVTIEINDNQLETYETLHKVLDRNDQAARELCDEIYKKISTKESQEIPSNLNDDEVHKEIGIWIDPIDATAEYIHGNDEPSSVPNIQKSGLQCATVLIGVYDKKTSIPLIGVVCVPFAVKHKVDYSSQIYYGVCFDDFKYTNVPSSRKHLSTNKIAITSSSEPHKSVSFDVVAAAGAGYKALKVIQGDADVYYLSKASTFKWDTCACQAILMAMGGDIVDMKSSILEKRAVSLKYQDDDSDRCNRNGLIAYRCVSDFQLLIDDLSGISFCN